MEPNFILPKISKNDCFTDNLALVYFLVNRFSYIYNNNNEKEDLIQVSLMALYNACNEYSDYDHFDKSSFSSYASYKIVEAIKKEMAESSFIKVNPRIKRIKRDLDNKISDKEVMMKFSCSLKTINYLKSISFKVSSLNELNNLEEEVLETVESFYPVRYTLEKVSELLDNKQYIVIKLKYFYKVSQKQIARVLKISQSQVSRLEKKALSILKESY